MVESNQILVVDDDDDIREVMQEALVAEGFRVDVAKDGQEALSRLETGEQAPLILLDMMMPRMDGETFLKVLRERPRLADARVVVISGNARVRDQASDLRAAACFVKPFELEELLSVIRRLTRQSQ
jgi:CheY-like chemotaxis protein